MFEENDPTARGIQALLDGKVCEFVPKDVKIIELLYIVGGTDEFLIKPRRSSLRIRSFRIKYFSIEDIWCNCNASYYLRLET